MTHLRTALSLVAATCVSTGTLATAAPLLAPTVEGAETYGETFTVAASLGGDKYIQAQLAVSNLGPGDGNGACRFTLIEGGKETSAADKFGRKEWRHSAAPNPKLTVGPCSLEATGDALVFKGPLNKAQAEIRLLAKAQRIQRPGHKVTIGGKFYDVELVVPWAKAEVSVTKNGFTKRYSGHGYSDHSRSTILPGDLASRWVRFRALDPARGRLLLARYPAKGGAPKAWAWPAGQSAPRPFQKMKVSSKKMGKTPMYRVLAMVNGKTWKMTTKKLLQRHAPVEKHGMLGRTVGSVVGNPVTYTYTAVLEEAGRSIPGILEVTVVDE